MRNPDPFLGISKERRIQWWAVLNCPAIPNDLPRGLNPNEVFDILTKELPASDLLAFWNGDFKGGLNKAKYINP